MEGYPDNELEFIRREIKKMYETEALAADDIVIEIPQYPKSVADEKFNFLSEYVEKKLHKIAVTSAKNYEELDDFKKENYRISHTLSATLKKLYCEQHYKKINAERKTEQFKPKSINRFYLYFSEKRRNDFWKEKGSAESNKILSSIQDDIDCFYKKNHLKKAEHALSINNQQEQPSQLSALKKQLRAFKILASVTSFLLLFVLAYYFVLKKPIVEKEESSIRALQQKMPRTPASIKTVPGLTGTWYSYNRTPETNEENKHKGTIFRRIEWKIFADSTGNLLFRRPTGVNENDGWVELINMQINFFMNVHPKLGEKNEEQNFGFRHFICKPNVVDINRADTLWCVCTSFIHKDGRLEDPLASREIIIRKKEGQNYATDLLVPDSVPLTIRNWFPEGKSYLKLEP